jgi:hypothetical protein
LSLITGSVAGLDTNTKGEVMQPLNHVMHNPFKALAELCVLGGQDYFCLEENVSGGVISVVDDGDRASATSAKWLRRASF